MMYPHVLRCSLATLLVLSFCGLSACSPSRPKQEKKSVEASQETAPASPSITTPPREVQKMTMNFSLGGFTYTLTRISDRMIQVEAEKTGVPDSQAEVWSLSEELTVDVREGNLRVVGPGEQVLWAGHLVPFEAFGRAGVPGLLLEWKAQEKEAIYGLGERFDALDQAGKRVDLWIVDAPGQGDLNDLTYFTTPILYSSAGYGLFPADNPEGIMDLNSGGDGFHRYSRPGRAMTFTLSLAPNLREQLMDRMRIQGPVKSIPDWAWGPWISKNSYENQGEAEAAIQGSIDRDLPVAAIVQEAWKGSSEDGNFNNFNTDYRWPELDRYLNWCETLGIRNVLWQVPILHPASPHYQVAAEKGYFVKKPDGSISHREHWLAGFANIDFTNPDAVKFWQDLVRPALKTSVAGFKADDGEDIKPDDVFFDGRRGWEMHNEWSYLYNQALTDLLAEEKVDGMLWARSGSLGIEKTPGLWAGDQFANWMDYRSLLPAGLSASISGAPFWSHDIGGYIDTPTPELYIRWAQFGALSPLMQYHGVTAREPWLFGEEALNAYRTLAHLRMNLKPYLIGLGKQAEATGLPIMRPMTLEFPEDQRFLREETQYMLGPDLLVTPVLEPGVKSRVVRFPAGIWHHLTQRVAYEGPSEQAVPMDLLDIPLFLREGAAIPVHLDEGAELGHWRAEMAFRTLVIDAERSPIRNLDLSFYPDTQSRTVSVGFDVLPTWTSRVEAGWAIDEPGARPEAGRLVQTGRRITGTWQAAADRDMDGKQQILTLSSLSGSHRVPLVRAVVSWGSPVELLPPDFRDLMLRDAPFEVTTTLVNHEPVEKKVQVSAAATAGVKVSPAQQVITLAGAQTQTIQWTVTRDPSALIGDERIRWVVKGGEGEYTRLVCTLPTPATWVITGPFPEKTGAIAHRTPYAPEWEYGPEVAFQFPDQSLTAWDPLPRDQLAEQGVIDFGAWYGPTTQHASAYALTRIRSDGNRMAELRFGSDDSIKVWLNGELIHELITNRASRFDDDIVLATLSNGVNTLLVKVSQNEGDWDMAFHVTAPGGGQAEGFSDGFDDIGAYVPGREPERTTSYRIQPLPWQICGPIQDLPIENLGWKMTWDRMANDSAWPPTSIPGHWMPIGREHLADNLLDFEYLFGEKVTDATVYAITTLTVRKPTKVELRSGSDDGLTLWLNGLKVLDANTPRGFQPDDDITRVSLPPGKNRLVARITQRQGDWKFQMNALDQSVWPARPITE
ncbi:MAG: glycoside hydrolase family 31 protein [Verrucomicrobia bacterium]|nr:glycoside hydrolase family 31 protein [Verrucomicrobiota bacterium]